MTHTAEEVRTQAERLRRIAGGALEYLADAAAVQLAARQLTAYAALLERREAGVTEEVVEAAMIVLNRAVNVAAGLGPDDEPLTEEEKGFLRAGMHAALNAVWPVAAEPAQDNYQCMSCMAKDYGLQPTVEPVQPADSGRAMDVPMGAIENGRIFADRLESTGLECEAGNLAMCSDWQEFRRCFEYLSEWALHLAAQGQPAERVPDGWRPIETAPRDGTTIIVGRDMGDFGFVRGYAHFVGRPGAFISGWVSYGFVDPPGNLGLADPTFWMPVPAAPQPGEPNTAQEDGRND